MLISSLNSGSMIRYSAICSAIPASSGLWRGREVRPPGGARESRNSPGAASPAGSPQLGEQSLGVLEVGRVEALGEPGVDRCEDVERLAAPALVAPEPGQARGRAQLVIPNPSPSISLVDGVERAC